MGLLSWLTGKSPKQEEINPFPSDRVIVGKIATLIEFYLYEETRGLAELLKPTCAAVLDNKGNISLRALSGPESVHDAVSFAFLNDLPAFNNFVQTLVALSKSEDSHALTKSWLQSMGPTEVDTIAAEALCELKSKYRTRLAVAEKLLTPGGTDRPEE